jgi:outer membrane protein OmpA-like peptidoglycan-associated protein
MKFIGLLFLFLLHYSLKAQNLLVNNSFEDENICTEYNVDCAPEGWLVNDDVFFSYFKDSNRSHTGIHCMAIEAGHAVKPYKRTFIRSQLLCGLRKGNEYALEFFIKSPHPIFDSIGIYFTPTDFLFDKNKLQNIVPSFYLKDLKKDFTNDSSWQKVEFVYKANGSEAFITIANFSKRDITGPTGITMENNYFIFIDDVSIVPVNPNETLCDDWRTTKQKIYEQDERHEFLRRKIKEGRVNPPDPVRLSKNTVFIIDTLVIPDILFETGKANLHSESFLLLDSLCRKIAAGHLDSVIAEGHTDNTGSYELNERLSLERVESVKKYLQNKTSYQFIVARGWGYRRPVAGNETPEGRKQNRRVEVFLYTRE